MCKLHDHLANQWRWHLVLWSVLSLSVCGYFWVTHETEEHQKGTLVVKCSSWDYVVEILSDNPADDQALAKANGTLYDKVRDWIKPRESKWRDWGSEASSSHPLVGELRVAGEAERHVRLRPGTYQLIVHPKSPCGHYGGTIRKEIEVKQGEQVEYTIQELKSER